MHGRSGPSGRAARVGDHVVAGRGLLEGVGDGDVVEAHVLVGAVGVDVAETLVGAARRDLVVVVVGEALRLVSGGRGRDRRRPGADRAAGVHGGDGVGVLRAGAQPGVGVRGTGARTDLAAVAVDVV